MASYRLVDLPLLLFVVSFGLQWAAARAGVRLRSRRKTPDTADSSDFETARNVAFTLLAVIIGFTLSMSVSRFDQRKSCEEAEANAIGTEFSRLELLPTETTVAGQALLRDYLRLRLASFSGQDPQASERLNVETERAQTKLWEVVAHAAASQPTPVTALAIAGMNEVIDSQGFMLAAWRNRLPLAVWGLTVLVAIGASFLFGFGASRNSATTLWVLPLSISIAFLLIAEIDSPSSGFVRVQPENLLSAARTIGADLR
jgi:hypothetical protein